MKARLAATLLATLLAFTSTAFAAVPSLLSYQGRVSDASGTPIGNTSPVNRTVTFKLYSTSTGGVPLYAEAQTVTLSVGEFSVLLGNGTGVSGFRGPSAPATTPLITLQSIMSGNIYLGVTVDDGTAAADPEITPRQQIVSAAYAFRAQVAETVVDGALNTAMIANTAITTDKLSGGAVTNAKLANDAVNTVNIIAGSINDTRLANNAVTNAKLNANAVTSDKIADGTIITADLADGLITSAKIADGTVTSIDIADGTITTADLATGSVTSTNILDGTITTADLVAAIQQALTPTGTIVAFAGDTAPAGWLLCNGQSYSVNDYQNLYYNVIATRFGSSSSGLFNVPDLRGRFLRGRDNGAGRDPDIISRTAMNSGGATGDAVGSVQGDAFRSHQHTVPNDGSGGNVDRNSLVNSSASDEAYTYTPGTGFEGGNETRPTNANVNFIIKF